MANSAQEEKAKTAQAAALADWQAGRIAIESYLSNQTDVVCLRQPKR